MPGARLPLLVLVVALGLTLVGAAALHDAVRSRAGRRLDARVAQAVDGVRRRVEGEISILRSSAAFLDQDRPVNRGDFHAFVAHLEVERHDPGLRGIGYAPLVARDDLAGLEQAARAEGTADFRVRSARAPAPVLRAMAPVYYLEPSDPRNRQVIGFDYLSEAARRAAMVSACASGTPALTGPIALEPDGSSGFALVLPIAPRPGLIDPTWPCRGFAFATFDGDAFFADALGRSSATRVGIADSGGVLYDSGGDTAWRHGGLAVERWFAIGGRRWTVRAVAAGEEGGESLLAPGLGVLGAITSLALFLSTRSLVRARRRAESSAVALRREEAARAALHADERESRRRSDETGALLDEVVRAVPTALAVFDPALRVTRVNPAMEALTGVRADGHLGKRLDEVLPALDAAVGDRLLDVQRRSAPLSAEISIGTEAAGGHTYLFSGAPVRATGEVVAVWTDITERKLAEARLRRERDVLEVLVELAKEMNAQLDRNALIHRLAEVAREATGAEVCVARVDGVAARGLAGAASLPSRDLARRADALVEGGDQGWWRSRESTSALSRSGETLHVVIGDPREHAFAARHQAVISGLAQQATVALENARLFQESESLISALGRTNQALARSNHELDQFAYAASHDLKAPLRGIASLSHWIEEDLGERVGPETQRYLELMRGRVRRLENLVDGLLRYARAGRSSGGDTAVDLREVVDEVLALVAAPPPAQVVVDDGLPVVVGDRVSLEQIFLNLIGNALKHSGRRDVTIAVKVADDGDHWHFSVVDDGVGIATEFHERIWGMFQTLQSRDKVDSTGIGLALVRKVIETRGGRTWVESEPGRGAAFHVTWPH